MSETPGPVAKLREFAADLIAKLDEALAAALNPKAATHKKDLAAHKGKVTRLRKRLDELLEPLEKPALPGMTPAADEVVVPPTPAPAQKVEAPPEPETGPDPQAPVGPAVEQIELQVDVPPGTADELAERQADLEAALDRPAVDLAEDADGATVFFEYPTLTAARLDETVVTALGFDFVQRALVFDPHEARLSEEELARLDAAPRSLVVFCDRAGTKTCYCTRCVELGHTAPGEISVPVSPGPGSACRFCGWAAGAA